MFVLIPSYLSYFSPLPINCISADSIILSIPNCCALRRYGMVLHNSKALSRRPAYRHFDDDDDPDAPLYDVLILDEVSRCCAGSERAVALMQSCLFLGYTVRKIEYCTLCCH